MLCSATVGKGLNFASFEKCSNTGIRSFPLLGLLFSAPVGEFPFPSTNFGPSIQIDALPPFASYIE